MRPLLLAAALSAIVFGILGTHRSLARARASWPSVEERVLVPPPRLARMLSVGYGEAAADLAWARTLVYYGEGFEKGTSLAYVDSLIALVNALDPEFYLPYKWGAYATTYRRGPASQGEFVASTRILERGLARFPDDWELHWLYGLRHAYDLRSDDPATEARYQEIAATHIETAMRLPGAPPDLALIASRMRTRLGQKDRALRELREMILTVEDPESRAKLEARYGELASETAQLMVSEAVNEFEAEWKRSLPFAPASLYILLGPRPQRMGLSDFAEAEMVELGAEGAKE